MKTPPELVEFSACQQADIIDMKRQRELAISAELAETVKDALQRARDQRSGRLPVPQPGARAFDILRRARLRDGRPYP
ncbi:MAG: hypothetical protein H0V12_06420 [Chloroflexi bacterium]|nr:hypothetical protein [Chloroflexota bacterium]